MTMTATKTQPNGASVDSEERVGTVSGSMPTTPAAGEATLVVDPVPGDATGDVEGAQDDAGHDEIGPDGSEATEESAEASAEALAAPAGDATAVSDLRGIGGFDESMGAETAAATQAMLPDAGAALAGDTVVGNQEFLGLLAPLASAVVPWLATKAGPALARAAFDRLTDRAKRTVTAPPRGGGARPAVVRLFNDARRRAIEAGAESVDESAVDQIAQAMEVIIGTDDRVRVTTTQSAPWRWICALRIEFKTGAVYRGTGFLIGSRTVATAGHCVYLRNQGGWARRIEVIPGADGDRRPFGSAVAVDYRSTAGYVKDGLPTHDYGAIFLGPKPFGERQLGSFGFAPFGPDALLAQPAVLAGYPGDKPYAELWSAARKIKRLTPERLEYQTDSMGGQSGAGVYVMRDGKRYVVGIHNYGATTGNTATRVTPAVARNLQNWSRFGLDADPSPA